MSSIILVLYLGLLEVKQDLILSVTNLSTRKVTQCEKVLRKVRYVFLVKGVKNEKY